MQSVLYEDNGGRFPWSLVDEGGVSMAVSANGFGLLGKAPLQRFPLTTGESIAIGPAV